MRKANSITLLNLWSLTILVILPHLALSQEEIGLNPPSMKWSRIHTSFGSVIYPRGSDSVAFRVATLIEAQQQADPEFPGDIKLRNVPVIIQNQSTFPAGFATPAPWRMELSMAYPENPFLGPVMWPDILTIHEFRHAQQFQLSRKGLSLPWKILMGETGWLLNSLMLQPLWFREGDATYAETTFTNGGRGRLPSFHMEYRAMRLAGYKYAYEKAHFYSYKDFIPNPYRLGYYMTNHVRNQFGKNTWQSILYDTHFRKAPFYPFSRSLKEKTGMTTKELYASTMDKIDSIFQITDASIYPVNGQPVTGTDASVYTNYRYPHYLPDGTILFQKDAFNQIKTFYQFDGNKEKKLMHPGIYTDDHATMVTSGNLMAWAESAFDERWRNQDYSVIRLYNFDTGQTIRLPGKSRYFMPAPSGDGKKVAVIENDAENNFYLTVLQVPNGEVLSRHPVKEGYLTHIRWMDSRQLIGLNITEKGNRLVTFQTETGDMVPVLPETLVPITRPFAFKNYVFYSAGYTSIDNIYALDLTSHEVFQVTNVRFGAYEPAVSPDGSRLLFSSYTADGYRIREMALDKSEWFPVSGNSGMDVNPPMIGSGAGDITDFEPNTYETEKFNTYTAGLFNIYGWFPVPAPPEYGMEFYTRNLMSTLRGTLGTTYNTNENGLSYYATLEYAALYPVIGLEFEHGRRKDSKLITIDDMQYTQDFRQNKFATGLKFPFRLTQGIHETELELEGFFERYNVSALDSVDSENVLEAIDFNGFRTSLLFSRLRATARQHVRPRWGQLASIRYQEAFNEKPRRLNSMVHLYFPGFLKNHSFNTSIRYKKEVVDTYRYSDDFLMPRGYKSYPFEELFIWEFNYELPIWYPDISAGSVAFFQRFRGELFYDFARGKIRDMEQHMNSTGIQLYIDSRVFRLFEMTFAFRYSYILDSDFPEETSPFQFLITRFELAN